jgi:hypothetical protein
VHPHLQTQEDLEGGVLKEKKVSKNTEVTIKISGVFIVAD